MIRKCIPRVAGGTNLTGGEARAVMTEMLSGAATDAQIGAFLAALSIKGETEDELLSFASVMKEHCRAIHPNIKGRMVDTCGTGGDGFNTFNVSTVAALIAAGAGVTIAKHGNRSVTSNTGSADVLERLGVNLSQPPDTVRGAIERIGVGFMFAPEFHPALRAVTNPRKEIGLRTVFNLLGPLVNPAGAQAQVLGVAEASWVTRLAKALMALGCEEAMVVHGVGGLDEVSVCGPTVVAHTKGSGLRRLELRPSDFGLTLVEPRRLLVEDPEESARLALRLLTECPDVHDPKTGFALANAAPAILVGGLGDELRSCVDLAVESIASGAAYQKLRSLVELSGGDLSLLDEWEGSRV